MPADINYISLHAIDNLIERFDLVPEYLTPEEKKKVGEMLLLESAKRAEIVNARPGEALLYMDRTWGVKMLIRDHALVTCFPAKKSPHAKMAPKPGAPALPRGVYDGR